MTLELPADAEPFIPADAEWDHLHSAGVYCLELLRPDDPTAAWDEQHGTRPDYWADFLDAYVVWYVGSAKDVLARLEDHRDGERTPALLEICEVSQLRNVWWCEEDRRKHVERQTADMLAQHHPAVYVHQR